MKITIENWLVFFKKFLMLLGVFLLSLYLLFLLSPIVLTPIANKNLPKINKLVTKSTCLNLEMNKVFVYTTPKFDIGFVTKKINISDNNTKKNSLNLKNIRISLNLVSLLFKQVRLSTIALKSLEGNFSIRTDGSLIILEEFNKADDNEEMLGLPFGLKLSNNLPKISIEKYFVTLNDIDNNKKYSIKGKKLRVSNFVLDKSIKVSSVGEISYDKYKIADYDFNIYNKIMPDIQLNDVVFSGNITTEEENSPEKNNCKSLDVLKNFNVTQILENLEKNKFKMSIKSKLNISGKFKSPKIIGNFDVNKFSIAVDGKQLPESFINFKFNKNFYEIKSNIFTSSNKNEKTIIIANLKKNSANINVKSNSKLENVAKIIDLIIGKKYFEAKGLINADFSFNTDFKTINSSGFFNLNNGSIKYLLYNILLDKICSKIIFNGNEINVKNLSLEILNQPLKIVGKIKHNTEIDLDVVMDNVPLKGLVFAFGKLSLINENIINSGNVQVNAKIKGFLKQIQPKVYAKISGVNIYNKISNIAILLNNLVFNMTLEKDKYFGNIDVNNLVLRQKNNSISIPKTNLVFDNKDAKINNSYILVNNSRIDVKGLVKNYLKDFSIDIKAFGSLATSDIVQFIPKNVRKFIPNKGKLPLSFTVNGNSDIQNVNFKLSANPSNYVSIADIKALKGKQSNIISKIKISNGEAELSQTGLYVSNKEIVRIGGKIQNIFNSPVLNLVATIPSNVSFPIWGLKNSNITVNGKTDIIGTLFSPKLKGSFYFDDISVSDLKFSLKDTVANVSGNLIRGDLKVKEFKFEGLEAQNLSSDFSLKNFNNFYLSSIKGKSFEGRINGKMSYDFTKMILGLDLSGEGLNSTKAIYSLIYLKNALTGDLNFNTKFTTNGFVYSDIVRNLLGNANFEIKNGRFLGIGKVENIVRAQNIASNSLLKTAISGLSTLNTIQKTDKFDKITGNVSFKNGLTNIHNVKVYGQLMSYYITGTYYIISNSATLKILGRFDTSVVSCLGVLGSFSAEKLIGAIPKIGEKTLEYLGKFTQKPETENISLIPALTSGSTSYKDFKVIYTGNIQKVSSIRTFKWLSKCDTSNIDLKKEVKATIEDVKNEVTNSIETTKNNIFIIKNNITNIINAQKKKFETEIKQTESKQESAPKQETAKTSQSSEQQTVKTETQKVETPKTDTQKTETIENKTTETKVTEPKTQVEEPKTSPETKETNTETKSENLQTSGEKPDVVVKEEKTQQTADKKTEQEEAKLETIEKDE